MLCTVGGIGIIEGIGIDIRVIYKGMIMADKCDEIYKVEVRNDDEGNMA